jgi:hypothetical protein
LNKASSEGDLPDGAYRQTADNAMARRLRSVHRRAREKIINPFSLYIGDKTSYINMIRRQ